MKQSFIAFMLFIALLSGCKSYSKVGGVEGEIKGLEKDTIYIYGDDEFSYFFKPVAVKDGKFSFEMWMDTTPIQTMLYINEEEQYPIYLERGKTIRFKGDINRPGRYDVKGSPANEELADFIQTLPQPGNMSDTLTLRLVEEYIRENQKSLINIYLLAKYFVLVPDQDFTRIKGLVDAMDGSLQDKPYVVGLLKYIEQTEKAEVDKSALAFTLTNTEGKNISRAEFRDKYLLLSFWASWSDSCRVSNKELKSLYKAFASKKEPELAILGISLDMDKAAWKAAIKRDTLKWEQASDFLGWNSPVVEQYAIQDIPYNVLIDKRGKIIARGIRGEELRQKLDSLLTPKK